MSTQAAHRRACGQRLVRELRRADPVAFRYLVVNDYDEPIRLNAYGKSTRWAFAQRAAAETALRRARYLYPEARLLGPEEAS